MMWQVAPLSTSHLLLGSSTPIDWNFSERLISSTRCCSPQTLSVLELEAATVTGFLRTHMVISLIWLTDPLGSSPSGSGCSHHHSQAHPHLHSLHLAPRLLLLDNSRPNDPSCHSWSTSCPSNLLSPQVVQHARILGHLGLEFWCNSPGLLFTAVV